MIFYIIAVIIIVFLLFTYMGTESIDIDEHGADNLLNETLDDNNAINDTLIDDETEIIDNDDDIIDDETTIDNDNNNNKLNIAGDEVIDDMVGVKDRQLHNMKNSQSKFLPNPDTLMDANLSDADKLLVKRKIKENPLHNSFIEQGGINTISQSRRNMSKDLRPVPIVEKLPESQSMFTASSMEPDYFKAGYGSGTEKIKPYAQNGVYIGA